MELLQKNNHTKAPRHKDKSNLFNLIFYLRAANRRFDVLLCAIFLFYSTIWAQSPIAIDPAVEAPEVISRSALVMDAATGTVIYSKNPDEKIPPASLTKLMTIHLALKAIAGNTTLLDEPITPPRESWAINQPPRSSLMALAEGQRLNLKELLLGMAVFSGNDAATAAALRFAPTVDDFVAMMNMEAAALGFPNTRFADASGYSEANMTTAGEFAGFCRIYLEAHPESLKNYHSVREYAYPKPENYIDENMMINRSRVYRNNNSLLGKVEGVDGLKTGYIPESGYNIALTAERTGTRFIAVVLGAPSQWGGDRIRDADGTKLLEWAFANYKTLRPQVGALPPVRIWKGRENFVNPVPAEPLQFTALAERGEEISWHINCKEPLIAPLPRGSPVGELVLYDSSGELRRIPLVTASDSERGGFFKRLFDSIRLFFKRIKK